MTRRGIALVASVVLCACGARVPSPRAAVWTRTVDGRTSPGLLRVTTCFEGSAPAQVRLRTPGATLRGAVRGERLTAREGLVSFAPDTRCVREDLVASNPSAVYILPHAAWLWAPEPLAPLPRLEVRFELPDGWSVSTPWPDPRVIDPSALWWGGYTVVGPFAEESFERAGTRVDVARLGDAARPEVPVRAWLGRALDAVRTLDPTLPMPRVQVILEPTRANPEGVSFGLVSRGGGRSVLFFIDPSARPEAFLDDWQATHEFTHLLQPVLYDDDAWLTEGLATYYQEVLRARVGAISPARCWANLARGLRGGASLGGGLTLAEQSAAMRRGGGFGRVYWWGAAFALTLDVALRRQGTGSLDEAVRSLHAAGAREPMRPWRATEALAAMDAGRRDAPCSAMGREAMSARAYPDVEATLRELGVRVAADGAVSFDDAAPLAAVREAITRRELTGG